MQLLKCFVKMPWKIFYNLYVGSCLMDFLIKIKIQIFPFVFLSSSMYLKLHDTFYHQLIKTVLLQIMLKLVCILNLLK